MILTVGDLANDIVVQRFTNEIDPHSDTPARIQQTLGGSAANVAAISARLGRGARFVGPIGPDATGEILTRRLEELGVETNPVSADRSISIVVLVDPAGDRQFLTDRPTTEAWESIDVANADCPLLSKVSRVHFTGYALCNLAATSWCETLAGSAQAANIAISVDPSSVSVLRTFGTRRFCELVDRINPDLFLPNADEAELLGDWSAPGITITSYGAQPTVIAQGGRIINIVPVPDIDDHIDRPRVVDTTGAGDALSAGILASVDSGATLVEAVRHGHEISRRVISGPGADYWPEAL